MNSVHCRSAGELGQGKLFQIGCAAVEPILSAFSLAWSIPNRAPESAWQVARKMRIARHVNLCDAGMNAGGEVAAGEFPEREGSPKLAWLFSLIEF